MKTTELQPTSKKYDAMTENMQNMRITLLILSLEL